MVVGHVLFYCLLQVIDFKIPSELNEQIDFKVGENGVDTKEILSICDKVLSLSVHTCELITGDCIIKNVHDYYNYRLIALLYMSVIPGSTLWYTATKDYPRRVGGHR